MNKLKEIKTSKELLDALVNASSKKQSATEVNEQRVSFIYGSMDHKSGLTRSRIQEILTEQQGIGS